MEESLSSYDDSVCLVFDHGSFIDCIEHYHDCVDSSKVGLHKYCVLFNGTSEKGEGVVQHGGVSVHRISSWHALGELIKGRFKTLHLKTNNCWPPVGFIESCRGWGLRLVVDYPIGKNLEEAFKILSACDEIRVHSREEQYRLIGKGISAIKVKIVNRYLPQMKSFSWQQRRMLRRAYSLPDCPLIFIRHLRADLLANIASPWRVVSIDSGGISDERVICVGSQSYEVERGYLRACDAFIYEGGENYFQWLIEALRWSVEVFTTKCGGIEDLYEVLHFSFDEKDLFCKVNGFGNLLEASEMRAKVDRRDSEIIEDTDKRKVVTKANIQPGRDQLGYRVLFQNRPNANECPGGDTVVMHRYADLLRQRGIIVDINHDNNCEYTQYDLIHLFNFALPELLQRYAKNAVAAGKPFVVTTLCEDIPEFYLAGQAFAHNLIEYVRGGQLNYTWDKHLSEKIGRVARFDNEWVASMANRLLVCGSREGDVIRRDYPKARISEVKFGIDKRAKGNPETMEKVYGVRDYVLCVGRLEYRKNQLGLLKALEDTNHTVVLATGGFSYSAEYDEACRKFKRRGRTIFLERLSDSDLCDVYAGARVHVLPSWYELPGLVSLEAAWHGCNIVVSDRGTISNYVGKEAIYCEVDDVISIRDAILQAYDRNVNNDLARLVGEFSWEASVNQLIKVYDQVLTERGLNLDPKAEAVEGGRVEESDQESYAQFFSHLQKGEEAARLKDYVVAAKELKAALHLNSKSSRALRALGVVYLAQGENKEACASFEKAVENDKGDGRSRCGYGMALLAVGDVKRAHDQLLESARIEPYEIVTLFNLIKTSYQLDRMGDLIEVLSVYCAENKHDAEMRYCLAGAYFRNKDYVNARHENAAVLDIMPTHSGALELVRQLEATRLDSVGGEAKETAICEFDDIDLKIVEFEDLKRRGDFRGVLYKVHELLEEGGRIRGDQDVALRLLMAEAVLLQGEVERGSGLIADLFSKFGDNDRVVCSYAAVLCMRGQWDEAHNLFMRALRINPRSDIALAGIGGFLQEKGDLTGAWQRYSEALSINVECKRALLGFIQIGHLERKFKDLEKALRDYLELHPADVDFLYALAGCLYADGRYEEARDPLFRIRIFDPQNSRMTELLNIVEDRISMAPVVASPG